MNTVFELAPVIADIIAAHCPGTSAREWFLRACLSEHWEEAKSMVEGMLAEPWLLNPPSRFPRADAEQPRLGAAGLN